MAAGTETAETDAADRGTAEAGDIAASRVLTLAGARKALDAALDKAEAMGRRFCIAVTDASGEAIATARMDGAPRLSAGIALNKAFTVAGFAGMPTGDWWDLIKDEPALVHGITHTPRLIVFGGGIGIFVDGALVGAVGVSGGSAEEDAQVAQAGAAALAASSR
ncbi:GlcG/HbpS family heme-binding protein [Candidatus Poriferisodalis sp.]|uniref:GlcG/HbpS family heme-binding protein n=1 Tax=Candidatus Poriferisodalis sp. TaxID=3101277 RepID=UPI003B02518E